MSASFIHSSLDDYPLSWAAFRVYCHLLRRAGKEGEATPSYASIGEHCFRASWPDAKPETLRRRAIEAVAELVAKRLVAVEVRRAPGQQRNETNRYVLTDPTAWMPPAQAAQWRGETVKAKGSATAPGPQGSAYAPGSAIAPPPAPREGPAQVVHMHQGSAYAPKGSPDKVLQNINNYVPDPVDVLVPGTGPTEGEGGRLLDQVEGRLKQDWAGGKVPRKVLKDHLELADHYGYDAWLGGYERAPDSARSNRTYVERCVKTWLELKAAEPVYRYETVTVYDPYTDEYTEEQIQVRG